MTRAGRLRGTGDDDPRLEIPGSLGQRFDGLDDELPPTPRWRPATAATDEARAFRSRHRVRMAEPGSLGTLAWGALAVVLLLGAIAVLPPGRDGAPDGSAGPGGPGAASDSPATGEPTLPIGSGELPSMGDTASAAPPAVNPTPQPSLRFAKLRLIRGQASVEDVLTDELAWSCPARVAPPTAVDPRQVAPIARKPGSAGLRKLTDGSTVFIGANPEAAALSFGASLAIADDQGELWVVIGPELSRVRRLAPAMIGDKVIGWWLADSVIVAECPSPLPTTAGAFPGRVTAR